jgi:hypothetical protein
VKKYEFRDRNRRLTTTTIVHFYRPKDGSFTPYRKSYSVRKAAAVRLNKSMEKVKGDKARW